MLDERSIEIWKLRLSAVSRARSPLSAAAALNCSRCWWTTLSSGSSKRVSAFRIWAVATSSSGIAVLSARSSFSASTIALAIASMTCRALLNRRQSASMKIALSASR